MELTRGMGPKVLWTACLFLAGFENWVLVLVGMWALMIREITVSFYRDQSRVELQ